MNILFNNMRLGSPFLFIVAIVVVGLADDFTDQLQWSPLIVKTPFLVFINDFNYPSWRSRNPLTKMPDFSRENEHLRLPKGLPLALICGACFRGSLFIQTNLSIDSDVYNITSVHQKVPPTVRLIDQYQFPIKGGLVCMMTYFITLPIMHEGTITCTLHRGKQKITEELYFDTVEQNIIQNKVIKEVLEIKRTYHGESLKLNLKCICNISKPLVYVWYYKDYMPIPYTKSTIQLPLSTSLLEDAKSLHIFCSVYNILGDVCLMQYEVIVKGNMVNIAQENVKQSSSVTKLRCSHIGHLIFEIIITLVMLFTMVIY